MKRYMVNATGDSARYCSTRQGGDVRLRKGESGSKIYFQATVAAERGRFSREDFGIAGAAEEV